MHAGTLRRNMGKRDTDEMNTELSQAKELKTFLEDNMENFSEVDFPHLLKAQIKKKKINKAQLAQNSGMSDVYLYQLLSGRRSPSRSRVICICIGLGLTVEETQKMLFHAGMGSLYARNRWDAIILYGISHELDLFTINDLLYQENEKTLI